MMDEYITLSLMTFIETSPYDVVYYALKPAYNINDNMLKVSSGHIILNIEV